MTKIQIKFMHGVMCNLSLQTEMLELLLEKNKLVDPVMNENLHKQKLANKMLFEELTK